MSVLIAVPWDQEVGGVATVVGNLARDLSAHGEPVLFLHPADEDRLEPRPTRKGFPGIVMRLRGPANPQAPARALFAFLATLPRTLSRLAGVIRRGRIRIVNAHYPHQGLVAFALLRHFLPFKFVVSVHGADLFPKGQRRSGYPASLRFILRSADRIVAPSEAFRREVVSIFPALAEKTVAIHNGIDFDAFAAPVAGGRAIAGGPYVVCVADYKEGKGLDVLIAAFAQVARRHPDLKLVLAGDGPLRPSLEAQARALGIEARVVFVGHRGRADIHALLSECEVFVLPSRSESFGIAPVEAAACAKPIVVSAVGGLTEIITDGQNGLLVPPGDSGALAAAVGRVLDDKDLARTLSARARETARTRFTQDRNGAAYRELFAALTPN